VMEPNLVLSILGFMMALLRDALLFWVGSQARSAIICVGQKECQEATIRRQEPRRRDS
jgi:hypothetical protein